MNSNIAKQLTTAALRENCLLLRPAVHTIPKYKHVTNNTLKIVKLFSQYMSERVHNRNLIKYVLKSNTSSLYMDRSLALYQKDKIKLWREYQADVKVIVNNVVLLDALDSVEQYWVESLHGHDHAYKHEHEQNSIDQLYLTRNVVEFVIRDFCENSKV